MKTKIVLFNITNNKEILSSAKLSSEDESVELFNTDDIKEVKSYFLDQADGILLFSLKTKEDLREIISLFKKVKLDMKSNRFKVAFVQDGKNIKIESILRKFQCNEFLDSSINQRSMSFKFDFWLKTIFSNLVEKEGSKEKSKANNTKARIENDFKVKEISSLDINVDVWLSLGEKSYKKVLSKWLMLLNGPSPLVSKWKEIKRGKWQYEIDSHEMDKFYLLEGHWFFEGDKPDYDWENRIWRFSSNEPFLYFEHETKRVKKVFLDGKNLCVCANSQYALSLETKIKESEKSDFNIERAKLKEKENKEKVKGIESEK